MNRVIQECFAPARTSHRRFTVPFQDRSGEGGLAEGVLYSLAKTMELRDSHTAIHCERLAYSGVALGVAMGLDSASLLTLYLGGYLHDVGKIGIPDSVLLKPGKLNDEEWAVMRSHPVRGEEICYPLKSLRPVLPLIRSHHERLDGSGYPDKLVGDEIPLLARVLQTVDIYDALTNPRPYKVAFTRQRALEIMEEETDRGWRDKDIMARFINLNKRVLENIDTYRGVVSDKSMQDSFGNLQQFLAS